MEPNNQMNFLQPQPLTNDNPQALRPKKKGWLFFIIFLILVFGISCAYHRYSNSVWPREANVYDPVTLKPKKISFFQAVKNFVFHSNNLLEGQIDDRVNILLLGMGGPGHDGPYLTDTNIIISIKPSTKEVAMVSIPRDTGVIINGHGLRKINYADAFGESNQQGNGGEYAREIFAKTFGVDLPYYIRVDFTAFQELVDEVGGVTVNVTQPFTDSQFPGPNYSYQTITFQAGVQTFNGERALQYARSRHGNNGEGSDFARSRRQQQILTALKEKLLSFGTYTNPIRVQNMLQTLSTHITTNLDFGQLMYLANLGREATGEIKMLVLDNSQNGYMVSSNVPGAGYILSPKTGNFDQIKQAINDIFNPNVGNTAPNPPTENKEQSVFPTAKIQVQNGTWLPGLAARIQKKLQDKGFTVLDPENSAQRPFAKTQIYLIRDISEEVKTSLLKEFSGADVKTGLPDWLPLSASTASSPNDNLGYNKDADVIVVLGTDTKE